MNVGLWVSGQKKDRASHSQFQQQKGVYVCQSTLFDLQAVLMEYTGSLMVAVANVGYQEEVKSSLQRSGRLPSFFSFQVTSPEAISQILHNSFFQSS